MFKLVLTDKSSTSKGSRTGTSNSGIPFAKFGCNVNTDDLIHPPRSGFVALQTFINEAKFKNKNYY